MWFCIYLGVLIISSVLSLVLTRLVIGFALKIDFVDRPGFHKGHSKPVPLLGGAAIFLSMVLIVFGGLFIGNSIILSKHFVSFLPKILREYFPGSISVINKLYALFGGAFILFILGLIDDKKNLGALSKLLVQILAGSLVFLLGIRVTLFTSNIAISYFVTVFWILVVTNSFNLLDNMDGLSGGIACVAGGIFLLLSSMNGQYFVSLLFAAYIGSILGFLYFNFHPAKIYMGDAGSMVIGFFMAVGTLLGTYYYPGLPTIFAIAMPLLILGVPIYDTFSVIVIRVKEHRPIYQGDRNHFSHRLVELGMSKPGAVVFIYLVTFATGISALLLQMVEWQGVVIILMQVLVFLSIIAILEYYGKKRKDTASRISQ